MLRVVGDCVARDGVVRVGLGVSMTELAVDGRDDVMVGGGWGQVEDEDLWVCSGPGVEDGGEEFLEGWRVCWGEGAVGDVFVSAMAPGCAVPLVFCSAVALVGRFEGDFSGEVCGWCPLEGDGVGHR